MRHVTWTSEVQATQLAASLLFYIMIMEFGGDDLQDNFVIESFESEEEDESFPPIPGIGQDSEEFEDDRVNAVESGLLLAKKRKRKAKDKERKAKVRSCG